MPACERFPPLAAGNWRVEWCLVAICGASMSLSQSVISKRRRVMMWLVASATGALALTWLLSGFVSISWENDHHTSGIILLRGVVSYTFRDSQDPISQVHSRLKQVSLSPNTTLTVLPDPSYNWRIIHYRRGSRTIGQLPLWCILCAMIVAGVFCSLPLVRAHRWAMKAACAACGYDLGAGVTDRICPECGRPFRSGTADTPLLPTKQRST